MNQALLRKILGAAVTAFSITTTAHAVTIDISSGNIADLVTAVGNSPDTSGSGVDLSNDAGANGFDITNTYFHYDIPTDTFYLGFQTFGQLGTAGGSEGSFFPNCSGGSPGSGSAGVVDGCENLGFNIDLDNDGIDFELDALGDFVIDSGIDSETGLLVNPGGATEWHWIFSEANDAVMFSVTGFAAAPFSVTNPRDVTVNFFSGTINNAGNEDSASISTQLVPVPAAVWLFGSGLAGLLGFARRSKNQSGEK